MVFENKVAVVTGAAVGMGREFALLLAKEGAKVVVNYSRSEDEASETVSMIEAFGGCACKFRADVTKEAECDKLMLFAKEAYGKIDILINNVGATKFIPFEDMDALTNDIWDKMFDINVKSVFFCTRAAAKYMETGTVINMASQAGLRPMGSCMAYSVAKSAVVHLTKCLASTLAPNIRVNCISPGVVKGTRWNAQRENFDAKKDEEQNAKAIPLKMVAVPEDIAAAVKYLCSDDARFITGIVLPVDGGRTL